MERSTLGSCTEKDINNLVLAPVLIRITRFSPIASILSRIKRPTRVLAPILSRMKKKAPYILNMIEQ